MEFFEFDNSFISGKGSMQTSLDGSRGSGFDYGGKEKMPCGQVQMYKSGTFTMSSKAEHDAMQQYCINNMPYQVEASGGNKLHDTKTIEKRFLKF